MRNQGRARGQLAWLVAAILWTPCSAPAQQPNGPVSGEFEWRFSLKEDQVAKSNIEARNICLKRHRFQIESKDLPSFTRLLGPPAFSVNPGGQSSRPVEFNSKGLKAGEYEGVVAIQCVTCPREKGCTQDRQLLHIYMTVLAPELEMMGTQAAQPMPATAGTDRHSQNFVPGRLLVAIPLDTSEAVEATAKELAASADLEVVEIYPLRSINAALIVYALRHGTDVLGKLAALPADARILMAQPDFVYETAAQGENYAQLQYGPRLIRADRLPKSVTGQGIKVSLIDTGLDRSHNALKGKIAEAVDVTGSGFTPDIHGTMLAGIIAAEPSNGAGISGIAPQAEILAVKACQAQAPGAIQAQCWSLTLSKGLDAAILKGARVINLSLGGPKDRLVTRVIDEGVRRGSAVVAAAGNDGPQGEPSFPAALPNVVAVTAVDAKERIYPDATQGEFIDLAAPGVEIVSTAPGNRLLVSSGTSLATAFVTGTIALTLQQHPELSPQAVQALLEKTAKDLGPPGKDPQFGSGLVDACQALSKLNGDGNLCY